MKVWLVKATVEDEYYDKKTEVKKFDSEQAALSFVGSVAMGEYNHLEIDSIHSVDLGYSPVQVKTLEPVLEKLKMVFRDKER